MRWSFERLLRVLAGGLMVATLAACAEEEVPVQELFALRNQGLLYLERGQLPEAEAQFARLVEAAPDEPLGHANLGLTYLRAGDFAEAEPHLREARRLDPASVEIALMLAKLYAVSGRPDEARELLEELREAAGDDVRLLYALAELDAPEDSAGPTPDRYLTALRQILLLDPANLPVRFRLAEALLSRSQADSALRHLEEIRRIPPEPPEDALPELEGALQQLRAGDVGGASQSLARFHEAMQVTTPYQSAMAEMGWVEGPLVGRPVLTFAPEDFLAVRGLREAEEAVGVRFVDAAAGSGLPEGGAGGGGGEPPILASGDLDGDGRDELLISPSETGAAALYRVQAGQFLERDGDVLGLAEPAQGATFADYDNDGWLDLLLLHDDGDASLLRNRRDGTFEDVSARAGIADTRGATAGEFVDADHDGDLDLVLVGGSAVALYRNNLDGTFTDVTASFGLDDVVAESVAFADLDGDGRTDLIFSGGGNGVSIHRNVGARSFADVTAASGLAGPGAAGPVSVADLDNDGTLDLLVGGETARDAGVWLGQDGGTFVRDAAASGVLAATGVAGGIALHPFDYDNDGWLDLLIAPRDGSGGGLRLLRNEGEGALTDRSEILPNAAAASGPAEILDVDDDGDQDVLIANPDGSVRLLRNDGGNLNRAVRIELAALGSGSGKNNDFGIGSRLQLRVGDLLQTRVVTERVTHFGLGERLKADVLRVEWPNGVPQVLYFPGSDQDVLELENLKGSCAFLYTWDGEQFRFVTDVMWRSALGMPLGLMGRPGSTTFASPGASQEYLRIPGEALQPRDGRYILQLTEELWETAYLDEVRLLAVDHPDSVDVYVDERFVPPGPVDLRLYATVAPRAAISAVDGDGNDLLPALRDKDDRYVSNLVPLRYQGLVEPHELILDLGEAAGQPGTLLVLRGWVYPTDASINVALSQQTEIAPLAPVLEVRDVAGRWVPAISDLSFPSGKDKTVVIELGNLFPTDDHRVRIRTNLQIYWDQAFVAREDSSLGVAVTTLAPASADLHYRGFSRTYRKGGRYGPHWFDYQDVAEESPWRTIEGSFTRFGDVLPLLGEPDDMYVVMAPGDETTVEFDATSAGEPPPGWKRDFLLYTVGWIKDADLNTAFGNTVEPLPFHGIREYPYAEGESYPTDPEHERYLREYNTRTVTGR